jgi:hypothetical protein
MKNELRRAATRFGKAKPVKKAVKTPKLATIERRYAELCQLRERLIEMQERRT